MAIEVTVPRLGWSMDEGVFVEWLKDEGEWVKAGEMLFILEGEKASQEIESFDEGFLWLGEESPQPGTEVAVGQVLAFLLAEGETAPQSAAQASQIAPPVREAVTSTTAAVAVEAHPGRSLQAKRRISPRARRLARELGIDYMGLQGSGRQGRIRARDILAVAQTPTADGDSGDGDALAVTTIRRAIADRMIAAVHEAAPVTLTTTADATALVATRQDFQADHPKDRRLVPSYGDMLLHIAARCLERHRIVRGQWRGDSIWIPNSIDISMAVDTEAGLLAPVVRNVPSKSLHQLACESAELIRLAQEQKLTIQHMQGGVFTISNLGQYGVDSFTPILNLPQSAILGVGRIRREVVVADDGFLARSLITLSLTFDHRVMDGAPAARFLQDISHNIEQPSF